MRIRRLLAALAITAAAMAGVLSSQGTAAAQGDNTWSAPAGWDWGTPAALPQGNSYCC